MSSIIKQDNGRKNDREIDNWQNKSTTLMSLTLPMPIAYTEKFRSVFGYFRAIVSQGEMSLRALRVCEDAARLNPANYSVWMYRRKVLEHLKLDYRLELEYITKMVKKNPKRLRIPRSKNHQKLPRNRQFRNVVLRNLENVCSGYAEHDVRFPSWRCSIN